MSRVGSIAEREHLKWQNAEPMANNPYSSEALQRRLICGKTKPMDIHVVLEDNNQAPDPKDEDKENKTLQSAFSEDLTDYARYVSYSWVLETWLLLWLFFRYGRDYYINDAKKACGTRKSMNDLKSFMDSDMISDNDAAANVEVEQVSQTFAQSKKKRSNSIHDIISRHPTVDQTKSYIMEKFLNDNSNQLSTNHVAVHRTPSLNLNLSQIDRKRASYGSDLDVMSFRTMPVRRNRNRPQSSESEFDIPTRSFQQLEAGLLHGNSSRSSLRGHQSSKNFVLNPIFDEETLGNGVGGMEKVARLATTERPAQDSEDEVSLRLRLDQPEAVVETVFNDMRRRWNSARDLNSDTVSRRSTASRSISNTLSGLWWFHLYWDLYKAM
jgi:hypothetical protein